MITSSREITLYIWPDRQMLLAVRGENILSASERQEMIQAVKDWVSGNRQILLMDGAVKVEFVRENCEHATDRP